MKKIVPELKRIISANDLIAKIVCVLLAVLLWAYISNKNIGEVNLKIPITYINLSESLIKSKVSDNNIAISLTGKKNILDTVNIKNIKAVVNLEQPEIGIDSTYPIEIIKDELPDNIELKLSKKEVNVLIDRKIYKKVRIWANISDNAADGYIIGMIRTIPDSVMMNGPESLIRKIDFVETSNISLGNNTGRIIKDVPIEKKNLQGISLDVSRVRVIIPVIGSADLIKFKKKIILRNKYEKYKYVVDAEEVIVYMQSNRLDIMPSENDIDVFVDFGLNMDDSFYEGDEEYIEKRYPIETRLKNDDIRLISLHPDAINVKIFMQ